PHRQRRVRRTRRVARHRDAVGHGASRARSGDAAPRRERERTYTRGTRAGLSGVMMSALARTPFDRTLLLVIPAAAFMLLLFVYPFLYGLWLSFNPKEGGALANYHHFFTTDNLWPTIWITLKLALPATIINIGLALPIAYRMRVKSRYQRWVT